MPVLSKQEIENVVPGESMMREKGKLPFDRPAKTSSPEAGIQLVFDAITEPKSARKLIKVLENGTPIDVVVDSMTMMLHGEGIVSPQALPIMAPAMAAMIENMASIAKVPINYTQQPDPWSEVDEDNVEKIVAQMTGDLLDKSKPVEEPTIPAPIPDVEEEGLMTRPVEGDM